ncbi:MAG: OmpH family outer membrane protein [Paludibacteraceae bacterium]|nr:OmpH family outer membrane protein [Paludibacteraceae bacterium]
MFKKIAIAVLCAMPFVASAQNTQIKLGHMDVQALFMSLPETAEIETSLKALGAQLEGEVKRMEEEYTRKLTEFKQGEATWDETIKKNRMEELQTLQVKMQNYYQTAQLQLQQKQEELQAPVREKIKKAINDVCVENGFLYVFDTNTMLYKSDSAIDITALVKKKMGVK